MSITWQQFERYHPRWVGNVWWSCSCGDMTEGVLHKVQNIPITTALLPNQMSPA